MSSVEIVLGVLCGALAAALFAVFCTFIVGLRRAEKRFRDSIYGG